MNKNGGRIGETFLIYFKNENCSRGPSFKSIKQFLKVLRELVKLKTNAHCRLQNKIMRKSEFSSKKEQNWKYQSFFRYYQNIL